MGLADGCPGICTEMVGVVARSDDKRGGDNKDEEDEEGPSDVLLKNDASLKFMLEDLRVLMDSLSC